VGPQEAWEPGFELEEGESATQTLDVPEDGWALSLQYHSQVPLTVRVNGVTVGEVPPSLEGFYLTGAGRGAFWPVGGSTNEGGTLEVEVEAAEPSGLQDLLGVERRTWLGRVAFSTGPDTAPLESLCGEYVDHYSEAGGL
jgi:hypothetical protein